MHVSNCIQSCNAVCSHQASFTVVVPSSTQPTQLMALSRNRRPYTPLLPQKEALDISNSYLQLSHYGDLSALPTICAPSQPLALTVPSLQRARRLRDRRWAVQGCCCCCAGCRAYHCQTLARCM